MAAWVENGALGTLTVLGAAGAPLSSSMGAIEEGKEEDAGEERNADPWCPPKLQQQTADSCKLLSGDMQGSKS